MLHELASFIKYNAYKFHTCCDISTYFLWRNNIPFYKHDIFDSLIHSSVDRNLVCFYFLTFMNNTLMLL